MKLTAWTYGGPLLIYFSYPQFCFHAHLPDGTSHDISMKYDATVGELRKTAASYCNEDASLLVLNMEDEMIVDEDETPLYRTSFLEENEIVVSVVVCLLGILPLEYH